MNDNTNINSIIFRPLFNIVLPTDIACTYSNICESAIGDINWALDKLAEDPTSTYAKELYRAAMASIDSATVMILRVAYPKKMGVFTAASKVLDIKCKRLGIKRYI